MTDGDRVRFLELTSGFVEKLAILETRWSDQISVSERAAWPTQIEGAINLMAWEVIASNFPRSLHATVDEVVCVLEMPRHALAFLNFDDRASLNSAFADAAAQAYSHRRCFKTSVQAALVAWLQDWTESNELDFDSLIWLARGMAVREQRLEKVNWQGEGF